ncbi:hypothetical protein [Planococcus chinensis]|uniref:Uncharacterized protein n=1 Tax=Planococcus chinensis TaxID=272917 RepID=A0ABW4QIB8_9BACL
MDTKEKFASWLKGPMVSKKKGPDPEFPAGLHRRHGQFDRLSAAGHAYWQFLLGVTPFVFLTVFLLKTAATIWGRKKEQRDVE